MSKRNKRTNTWPIRLPNAKKDDIKLIILEAADENLGLGCTDPHKCAKKIYDSKFGDQLRKTFGRIGKEAQRLELLAKIILEMIREGSLFKDEAGIYYLSDQVVTPSA